MPDFATLKRIAEELNVPIAFLFCECDEMAEMIKAFDNLVPEDKQKILELIKKSAGAN